MNIYTLVTTIDDGCLARAVGEDVLYVEKGVGMGSGAGSMEVGQIPCNVQSVERDDQPSETENQRHICPTHRVLLFHRPDTIATLATKS